MPEYRRRRVEEATYFFTVNLADRSASLLTDHIAILREAIGRVRQSHPFAINAWVVLPEHMHCLWTLPAGDTDYPIRWRAIRTLFSKKIPLGEARTPTAAARGERGIWQRRYWEHTIRNERDYAAHVDYAHYNPVKHGLADNVADWPYSTFHRAVRSGHYPRSWAGSGAEPDETGERLS